MNKRRVLSTQKLGIIALSLLLCLVFVLGITFSALQDSKQATGTIIFTGNLALAMQHGNSGYVSEDTLTLDLIPDYNNLLDTTETGNVYFVDKVGQVASLKWQDNASGGNDIVFKVFSDGNTNAYIKMTVQLKYTPSNASKLPNTAQEWQIFPKFGSSNYEMTYTQINEGDNEEYSFYAPSDRLVVSYPKFEKTSTYVTKTFDMYYVVDTFDALQAFAPNTEDSSLSGYTYLNKEINFSDIISDIQFIVSGESTISTGDTFELHIDCQASTFPSI